MPDADHRVASPISPQKDGVEKRRLAILQIPAQCIPAKISNLHQACEAAVYKERGLDQPLNLRPKGSLLMKTPHQARVFAGNGLVIVVYQQTVVSLAGLILRIRQVLLEP